MGLLILFFVLKGLFIDLFPVCLQFAISPLWLSEELDIRSEIYKYVTDRWRCISDHRQLHTLKTLTWQLEEWTCSMYSPCSLEVKESTWIRKGTPFSPPCFLGVNSVLMQFTWEDKTNINIFQIFQTFCLNIFDAVFPCRGLIIIYQYLYENRSILDRIPDELDGVEVQRVWTRLQYPHWQRDICKLLASESVIFSKSTSCQSDGSVPVSLPLIVTYLEMKFKC